MDTNGMSTLLTTTCTQTHENESTIITARPQTMTPLHRPGRARVEDTWRFCSSSAGLVIALAAAGIANQGLLIMHTRSWL